MAETKITSIEEFIRKVAKGEENSLEVAKQTLEDGGEAYVVALQSRQLQPEPPAAPDRIESPRRAHEFHSAEGLAAYLARYKTDNTVVLADVPGQCIQVILDETAKTGFEVVRLVPQVHPSFAPWEGIVGHTVPLERFAAFVMANRRAIADPNARELSMAFSQVRAAINITIQRGRGKKALNGVVVQTEIQGESGSELLDLPDEIVIDAPLYVGGQPQRIALDLLVTAGKDDDGDEGVFVQVTSAELTQARVEAFEVMVQVLRGVEGLVTAMGKPGHAAWEYLY